MLDRIINALREGGVDFDSVTLAEVLWLSSRIDSHGLSGDRRGPVAPVDQMNPAPGGEQLSDPTPAAPSSNDSKPADQPMATLSPPMGSFDNAQSTIPIATPRLLRARQAMQAALGPLMVRNPRPAFSVDLNATVDAIAEVGGALVAPQSEPGERRWLRLVLLTETGPQTPIWSSTFGEIEQLLRERGAFRSVMRLSLTVESGMPYIVDPDTNRKGLARERVWHRNVVIVIASDFVSSHWWSGIFPRAVEEWRQTYQVLLLHLLPRDLWRQTWTGEPDIHVSGQVPGGASASMLATQGKTRFGRSQPISTSSAATAIAQLHASDLAAWAAVVVAESGKISAIRLGSRLMTRERRPSVSSDLSADDRVAAFSARASGTAVELARYLSVTAPLSFPMMQWVQRALLPESETGHLAEFFLGGLLQKVSDSPKDDHVVYDFMPGVRERISLGMEVARALEVMRLVGALLQRNNRLENDPFLLVRAGELTKLSNASPDVRGFAQVTQEYLQRAGLLRIGTGASVVERIPSSFHELDQFAKQYEDIRGGTPASAERTRRMNELLQSVAAYARANSISASDIQRRFGSDSDGNRLVAIGCCMGQNQPAPFEILTTALDRPRSPFEQWAALMAIEHAVQRLEFLDVEPCIAALIDAMDDARNIINDRDDPTRMSVALRAIEVFGRKIGIEGGKETHLIKLWLRARRLSPVGRKLRMFLFGSDETGRAREMCTALGQFLAQAGWELHAAPGRGVGSVAVDAFRAVNPDAVVMYGNSIEVREHIEARADCAIAILGRMNTSAECAAALVAHVPLIATRHWVSPATRGFSKPGRDLLRGLAVPEVFLRALDRVEPPIVQAARMVRIANMARLTKADKLVGRIAPQGDSPGKSDTDSVVTDLELSLLGELRAHRDVILRTSWSPDGSQLAVCSVDKTVTVWDVESRRMRGQLVGHAEGVNHAVWSPLPAAGVLATCSFDRTIRIWSTNDYQTLQHMTEGNLGDVRDVCWSPRGEKLASASMDRVAIWDVQEGGRVRGVTHSSAGEVRRVCWIDEGSLVTAWEKGWILVFDPKDLKAGAVRTIASKPHLMDLTFSPDLRMLAACSADGAVQVWRWPDAASIVELVRERMFFRSVSFSHDGRYLAANTMGQRGKVHIWDTTDWKEVATIDQPSSRYWPSNVAWAPNTNTLATLSEGDTVVQLWRMEEIRSSASYNAGRGNAPPAPGRVRHQEDPQKDRWGGRRARNGRSIEFELQDTSTDVFEFDLVVRSTDGSTLRGPVLFHLHSSYPRSVIWIRKIRDGSSARLEQVSAYGVFTVGAQVRAADGSWTSLELDLASVRDIPQRFRDR